MVQGIQEGTRIKAGSRFLWRATPCFRNAAGVLPRLTIENYLRGPALLHATAEVLAKELLALLSALRLLLLQLLKELH